MPLTAIKSDPFHIEDFKPLRDSILWELQSNYFKSKGLSAWQGEVPFYISSNAFIAERYARLVVAAIKDILIQVVDTVLSLERMNDPEGTLYSIRLKRNAATELQKLMEILPKKYPELKMKKISNKERAQIRKVLSKLNLHIKVLAGTNDEPKSVQYYLSFHMPKMEAVALGSVSLRSLPIRVNIPDHVKPFEQAKEETGAAQ